MTVRFRLLGPVGVTVDDRAIALGHQQLRCMAAVLLTEANQTVAMDELIDRVWPEGALPRQPRRAVQHNIPLLRKVLAPIPEVALTRNGCGYRLSVEPDAIDLHRFHALLEQARNTPQHDSRADQIAAAALEQALSLWQGKPFSDLAAAADIPWLCSLRAALTARQRTARLDLTDIRLRQGNHAELLAELAADTASHPFDERLAGQYLLALYRSRRQAEALQHYHRLQRVLADELGTDPSRPLRQLHEQILAADPALAAPTPEPATRPSVPRQLPCPPRLFAGRSGELVQLDRHMDLAGTVAIGGTGGIGKTWLALHWAHQRLSRFPDGQLHVNLHGFDPTGQPVAAAEAVRGFLDALGVVPSAIPVDLEAQIGLYRSLLAGKRMLLVLDNARDIDQVTPLLPGTPTCTVLITSRRHLVGLAALYGVHLLNLDVLPDSDARELLAGHLGPERLAAEPDTVADLLTMCAGLPLAVRIVAARAQHHPTFPLAVLAEELRDASARLDGLNAGGLRVNLRAVLSWSVRALSPQATRLFGLLGIAPGPDISLAAAEALAALPAAQLRTVLRELEIASLVQQHVPGRYRMHDLVRLYASETAQHTLAEDARDAALRRILYFYTHTAHAADRLLNPRQDSVPLDPPAPDVLLHPLPDALAALAWCNTEHACLLAAQHTATTLERNPAGWQLAWALETFQVRLSRLYDRLARWQAPPGLATAPRRGSASGPSAG
ncbi:BTAD domain-containing putative transcriptional regulator [Amycolatopsis sp. NPDC004079]|uniref:AfsR/SARP family transcriptional regulator n=1 Tax=Amycolatopsis sp. NPDC004079 TaxID=3154549 RepID=UPI0033A72E83